MKTAEWQTTNRIGAAEGSIKGRVRKIAGSLQRRRHMRSADYTLDQPVPFFRYEEKDFVLLDGPAQGKSEIVATNRILLGFRVEGIQNRVLGIEKIVAAKVISAAVKIIGS